MVKIITDTTSGLPRHLAEEYDIPILPQIIIFGEESYRDDTELDTPTFLEKLRAAPVLPKTAAPPPDLYIPIFERLVAEGHTIICLHPSTELSGTVRSATVAARDFPDADIRVVDTRTIAGPLAAMVLLAAQWAGEGADADTILAHVHDLMARQRIYFMVDTLEYLHRGGRIGGAKWLLGSALRIKPLLHFRDGTIEPLAQVRTKRKAIARMFEVAEERLGGKQVAEMAVVDAGSPEEGDAVAEQAKERFGISTVYRTMVSPAIGTHAGPGTIGIAFYAES